MVYYYLFGVLIFSILSHPCSLMVYYYLFGVFLVNYYFQVPFNFKAILYVAKIIHNIMTELL